MSSLKSLVTKAYQVFKLRNNSASPYPSTQFPFPPHPDCHHHLPQEIKSIADMMHSLSAESVGLHRLYASKISRNMITFIEVVLNPVLTVVIIVIPPGRELPLHDHPNMMGLIKVLHGRIRVSTYTKVGISEDGRQPAVKMQESVLSRLSYPQVVTPGLGNVHAIAHESGEGGKDYAAFLDILSPPYDDDVGCHYYIHEEGDGESGGGVEMGGGSPCTLIEIDCPKDYRTISLTYPFQ